MATSSSTILGLSFNQDNRCFSVATTTGFTVHTTDVPNLHNIRRNFSNGGIALSQMLNHSNILALVGGGPAPHFPTNKVMIWDDHLSQCCGELCFRSKVRSVRLTRDRIVVVLMRKVYVYDLSNLRVLFQIETAENPKGLCEVSRSGGASIVLACVGRHVGEVQVVQYPNARTKFVEAHESSVACIGLTSDGRFMASASSKGTVIRVFNALDGTLLHELRRGHARAEIYSLSFSLNAQWLAVSSDKGTIHVFSFKDVVSVTTNNSHLSFVKGLLPKYYSHSERSVAQFRVPEGLQHIVAFGHQKNTVNIIGYDGSFYRCQFDPVLGGEMTQLEKHNFMST